VILRLHFPLRTKTCFVDALLSGAPNSTQRASRAESVLSTMLTLFSARPSAVFEALMVPLLPEEIGKADNRRHYKVLGAFHLQRALHFTYWYFSFLKTDCSRNPDSSAGIVASLQDGRPRTSDSVSGRGKSVSVSVQTGFGTHPVACQMDNGVSYFGSKATGA
jgi:hypothetical protein